MNYNEIKKLQTVSNALFVLNSESKSGSLTRNKLEGILIDAKKIIDDILAENVEINKNDENIDMCKDCDEDCEIDVVRIDNKDIEKIMKLLFG